MKKIIGIFFILLIFSACNNHHESRQALLNHIEAVMEEHPDSAFKMLMESDSVMKRQPRKTRTHHLLLLAEAQNKLDLPLPSDSTFQEVVNYYNKNGTSNQQMKAHYLLGCIYRDRKEAPQALQCYFDAAEKADTLNPSCDYTTLYRIYGQMSAIFDTQVMPKEELDALKKYSHYASKAGNIYEYIHGIELQVLPYRLTRDTAMILSIEQQVHDLYQEHGFSCAAAGAYTMSIYVHLARGNYQKAQELMHVFETESGLFDNEGNIRSGREHYYYSKGLYYLGISQLDSAEHYFKKLLRYNYPFDAYRGLLKVYQQKGDADAVLSYSQPYEASIDTMLTDIHAHATRLATEMYNYTRNQQIAAEKTKESERHKMAVYVLATLALLIIFVFYHFYHHFKTRKQHELHRLSLCYTELVTQYEHTKEELNIIETRYEALQQKNQEEVADIRKTFESFKQHKQSELNALQIQLEELQKQYDRLNKKDQLDILTQSPLLEYFTSKLNPRQSAQPITEQMWKEMATLFSRCLPSLYGRMTENNILSRHELHVTILTRLYFSTKDIAIILETSKQHISNTKESANKKLFADHSARTFMKNLEQA